MESKMGAKSGSWKLFSFPKPNIRRITFTRLKPQT